MKCVDADSHILPINMFQYVDPRLKSRLPDYAFLPDGRLDPDQTITVDPNMQYSRNKLPKQGHNVYGGRSNISSRFLDMESMGVDLQILNPDDHSMRFSYLIEPELACAMTHSYNRTIKSIIDASPDRFRANLMLPLQDLEWSLKEIAWAKDAGFTSVVVDNCWPTQNSVISLPLAAMPGIEQLFQACVEHDMLINIHEQTHYRTIQNLPMLKKYGLKAMYPHTNQTVLVSLVHMGIIDQFPDVKLLFCEGGMKFILSSLDYLESQGHNAKHYFGKNFFFTIESEAQQHIKNIIENLGPECLLFATDYPHDDPGGLAKFQDHSNIMALDISDEHRDLIMSGNARRLFKI